MTCNPDKFFAIKKVYSPIRMYIILIRAFVKSDTAVVVLLHQLKPIEMKSEITNYSMSVPKEIQNLIEACRKGDQKAQLQVYKLFYKPVYNLCLQIISDRLKAEELMHESFLLAFENINTYSADIEFYSWLINHIKYGFVYESESRVKTNELICQD